jgi:hypothetical protein
MSHCPLEISAPHRALPWCNGFTVIGADNPWSRDMPCTSDKNLEDSTPCLGSAAKLWLAAGQGDDAGANPAIWLRLTADVCRLDGGLHTHGERESLHARSAHFSWVFAKHRGGRMQRADMRPGRRRGRPTLSSKQPTHLATTNGSFRRRPKDLDGHRDAADGGMTRPFPLGAPTSVQPLDTHGSRAVGRRIRRLSSVHSDASLRGGGS